MDPKTCKECNAPLGEVHGNTQYCERCATKRRREKQREYRTRYRDRQNKGTLINAPVGGSEKKDANFPLALSPSQEQTEQVIAIIQRAFEPLFFSLNQRLVETNQRIQSVEDMQDEMFFTFYQSPEFQQQMKRQQYEIAEAKRLITQHENRLLLSQIRIIIEEKFQISKREAENILKKAHIQLQHERNQNQRKLDEWEDCS